MLLSCAVKAQSINVIKSDNSTFFLKSHKLFSNYGNENNFIPAINYTVHITSKMPGLISINNSRIPQYSYDNFKHENYLGNPVYPFNSVGSTLLCGSIRYIIFLH